MNCVVCYKDRGIIPSRLRPQELETIHDTHPGGRNSLLAWDITGHYQDQWGSLVRDASSQPAGVPVAPPSPSFPFQYVVGGYFSMTGVNYLILGDRFSGWLSIYEAGKREFDANGW
jgi:hypothetical protein